MLSLPGILISRKSLNVASNSGVTRVLHALNRVTSRSHIHFEFYGMTHLRMMTPQMTFDMCLPSISYIAMKEARGRHNREADAAPTPQYWRLQATEERRRLVGSTIRQELKKCRPSKHV